MKNLILNFKTFWGALLVYFLLSISTWGMLQIFLPIKEKKKAFKIAFEVATGGSPYDFDHIFSPLPNNLLFGWLLFFHVLSWLIVPILIGLAVEGAIENTDLYQKRKAKKLFQDHFVREYMKNGMSLTEARKAALRKMEEKGMM